MKTANFNLDYLDTCLRKEGYYDCYNYDAAKLLTNKDVISERRNEEYTLDKEGKKIYTYDFIFMPSFGFLGGNEPLIKDCEVRLSFDRAPPSSALMKLKANAKCDNLELHNVVALTEYVTSPDIEARFGTIDMNPIVYEYEEVELLDRAIPIGEKVIRLDNVRGGNIPSYIFAGIIKTQAKTGSFDLSSTNFQWNGVKEMNISLNGASVHPFPIEVENENSIYPLFQFEDTVGRSYNLNCGRGFTRTKFRSNFLWAYKFEVEKTSNGWIGINFHLDKAFTESMTMIIWLVYPCAISIDKFHKIEKMIL